MSDPWDPPIIAIWPFPLTGVARGPMVDLDVTAEELAARGAVFDLDVTAEDLANVVRDWDLAGRDVRVGRHDPDGWRPAGARPPGRT